MSNQLVVSQNDNFEQFLLKLNQATGYSGGLPVPPQIKFDAEVGEWKRETDKRDEENKPIYEPIGQSIQMHIITTRQMLVSSFDSQDGYYSRESQGNYFELYDKESKKVASGLYSALKEAYTNLVFVKVLYVFVDDKPYRIKLSGSKLTKLFPYLQSFSKDNPARWITIGSRGEKQKKGAVNYYELDFTKGDEIVDKELIVQRVNDVNLYLDTYAKSRESKVEVISQPVNEEEPPMIVPPAESEQEYNIPFTD